MRTVTLKIRRFDPDQDKRAYWATSTVSVDEKERLLDVLNTIKWTIDGSLTFRRSCMHGVCGSDAMCVNGLNRLACKLLMQDLPAKIIIQPLPAFPVIKDLVVDLDLFFAQYEKSCLTSSMMSHCPRPSGYKPRRSGHGSMRGPSAFSVPAAPVRARSSGPIASGWDRQPLSMPIAFSSDSRDRGAAARLAVLSDRLGVFRCRTIFNCTECCPRGIPVTELIAEVKRASLYDGTEIE